MMPQVKKPAKTSPGGPEPLPLTPAIGMKTRGGTAPSTPTMDATKTPSTPSTPLLTPATTPKTPVNLDSKLEAPIPAAISRKRQSQIDRDALSAQPPKKRKIGKNNGTGEDNKNDYYCWQCHREGNVVCCELCPRVYHTKCLGMSRNLPNNWVCPECEKTMRAECIDTRSKAMSMISTDQLCQLLRFTLNRMMFTGSEPFQKPVDQHAVPTYLDYVFKPVDMRHLERNIKRKKYGSTEAFMADAKWIQHNCIIFNGPQHKLSSTARAIVKICKHETNEIEICPDCYLNSCVKQNEVWFCEPCRTPHTLVWAKLKGYPFWPAKALRENDGQIDVRFFGAHDRSWVPVSQVFLLSKDIPTPIRNRKAGFESALEELELHITKIKEKFGSFEYAQFRTPYDRRDVYLHNRIQLNKKPDKTKSPLIPKTTKGSVEKEGKKHDVVVAKKAASALKLKYNSIITTRRAAAKSLSPTTPPNNKQSVFLPSYSASEDGSDDLKIQQTAKISLPKLKNSDIVSRLEKSLKADENESESKSLKNDNESETVKMDVDGTTDTDSAVKLELSEGSIFEGVLEGSNPKSDASPDVKSDTKLGIKSEHKSGSKVDIKSDMVSETSDKNKSDILSTECQNGEKNNDKTEKTILDLAENTVKNSDNTISQNNGANSTTIDSSNITDPKTADQETHNSKSTAKSYADAVKNDTITSVDDITSDKNATDPKEQLSSKPITDNPKTNPDHNTDKSNDNPTKKPTENKSKFQSDLLKTIESCKAKLNLPDKNDDDSEKLDADVPTDDDDEVDDEIDQKTVEDSDSEIDDYVDSESLKSKRSSLGNDSIDDIVDMKLEYGGGDSNMADDKSDTRSIPESGEGEKSVVVSKKEPREVEKESASVGKSDGKSTVDIVDNVSKAVSGKNDDSITTLNNNDSTIHQKTSLNPKSDLVASKTQDNNSISNPNPKTDSTDKNATKSTDVIETDKNIFNTNKQVTPPKDTTSKNELEKSDVTKTVIGGLAEKNVTKDVIGGREKWGAKLDSLISLQNKSRTNSGDTEAMEVESDSSQDNLVIDTDNDERPQDKITILSPPTKLTDSANTNENAINTQIINDKTINSQNHEKSNLKLNPNNTNNVVSIIKDCIKSVQSEITDDAHLRNHENPQYRDVDINKSNEKTQNQIIKNIESNDNSQITNKNVLDPIESLKAVMLNTAAMNERTNFAKTAITSKPLVTAANLMKNSVLPMPISSLSKPNLSPTGVKKILPKPMLVTTAGSSTTQSLLPEVRDWSDIQVVSVMTGPNSSAVPNTTMLSPIVASGVTTTTTATLPISSPATTSTTMTNSTTVTNSNSTNSKTTTTDSNTITNTIPVTNANPVTTTAKNTVSNSNPVATSNTVINKNPTINSNTITNSNPTTNSNTVNNSNIITNSNTVTNSNPVTKTATNSNTITSTNTITTTTTITTTNTIPSNTITTTNTIPTTNLPTTTVRTSALQILPAPMKITNYIPMTTTANPTTANPISALMKLTTNVATTPSSPSVVSIDSSKSTSSSVVSTTETAESADGEFSLKSKIKLDTKKYQDRMAKFMTETITEIYDDISRQDLYQSTVDHFTKQIEDIKTLHQQEINELRANLDLNIREMKNVRESEHRALRYELKAAFADEKASLITSIKKKQWCANCQKEAIFYCCWNTSYCDYPCQISHWPSHMPHCTQNTQSDTAVGAAPMEIPSPAKTTVAVNVVSPPQNTQSDTAVGAAPMEIPSPAKTSVAVNVVTPPQISHWPSHMPHCTQNTQSDTAVGAAPMEIPSPAKTTVAVNVVSSPQNTQSDTAVGAAPMEIPSPAKTSVAVNVVSPPQNTQSDTAVGAAPMEIPSPAKTTVAVNVVSPPQVSTMHWTSTNPPLHAPDKFPNHNIPPVQPQKSFEPPMLPPTGSMAPNAPIPIGPIHAMQQQRYMSPVRPPIPPFNPNQPGLVARHLVMYPMRGQSLPPNVSPHHLLNVPNVVPAQQNMLAQQFNIARPSQFM